MAIPADILKVKRPTNTVVICYGKNKDRYAVRKRVGCRYENGRRIPVNGPTVGHIVNHQYVPKAQDEPQAPPITGSDIHLKDWAGVALCNRLFDDLRKDLKGFYNQKDATTLACISILRVCYPDIKDCELKDRYDTSFLSEIHPGVALSKNKVSEFLRDLGKTCGRIVSFMRKRAAKVDPSHHVLIDGTLKTNDSKINSLSDFSRKSPLRGRRDISVLFAYDLEAKEPVCSKCYPGNMLDMTAYENFIEENGIQQGIIVADKGFPSSQAKGHFAKHENLHFLNPIRRNAKVIREYELYKFSDILQGHEGITYRKTRYKQANKWFYSFRDQEQASLEEKSWLTRAQRKQDYDYEELKAEQDSFGTIVLESDLDLPAEVVYEAYSKRWEIELVMRFYKFACCFDETREHDDYSVIGSEFCNFLSTVLTWKLIKEFDKFELLNNNTYK
ncbi:MAG: transposase, partial [Sutterellaceae bacterium]|nr:transposase [Sutterellaceae bacterium]